MNDIKAYLANITSWIDNRIKGDKVIWVIVIILSIFSIAAVYSSSSYRAASTDGSKLELFFSQLGIVVFGFGIMLTAYALHPKIYRKFAFLIYLATIVMMLMLFIPPLTEVRNGAIRGLKFFGGSLQVFEFAKVGIIIYLARALEVFDVTRFKDFAVKILLPIAATVVLLLRGSFSTALFIAGVCFIILWINKVRWQNLLLSVCIGAAVLVGAYGIHKIGAAMEWENVPFERFATAESRLEAFFSPEDDKEGKTDEQTQKEIDENRQSENAKIAIHEGGLLGKGPGKSTQRYTLSMAFSDFIFAFIIEEYGSVFGIFIMFLYLWLYARCVQLSVKCSSTFASTMVFGLGLLTSLQALMHILVNVRLLPITGHTLPLISHGGTAFLVFSGVFGLILSVSKQIEPGSNNNEKTITEEENENNN